VGVAGWPVTGRRRGRSQHYCGGLDCGTRTQNVSEYMLVLALCLLYSCGDGLWRAAGANREDNTRLLSG